MIKIMASNGQNDDGSFIVKAMHDGSELELSLYCEPQACYVGSELCVEWECEGIICHHKVDDLDPLMHGIRYYNGQYEVCGIIVAVIINDVHHNTAEVYIRFGSESMTFDIDERHEYSIGCGILVSFRKILAYDCNI